MDKDKTKKQITSSDFKNKKIEIKEFIRKAKSVRETFKDEDLLRLETTTTPQ